MGGTRRTLQLVALVAVAAVAALVLGAHAGGYEAHAGSTGADCANADASPAQTKPRKLRQAILCLVNDERASAGRREVTANRDLRRVAQKHTKVMRRKGCLRHKCKGEKPLKRRIIRSGYLDAGGRYGFGENIGCASSPATMVEIWMKRRQTRKVVLRKRFRDVGVGAVRRAPKIARCEDGMPFGTFTLLQAWRSKQP